jgi:hypothetical protein
MKVITLKQPWASLVANGYKLYEFRSWQIKYRGDILIHAGLGVDKEAMEKVKNYNLDYPSKKIIAIVHLDDCIKLDKKINQSICEQNPTVYGNKNRTGYAWKLSNIRKIENNEIISGKQGIWNYDLQILSKTNN